MHLVRHPVPAAASGRVIDVRAPRHQLAKTRWRASAEDGCDFGFDLEHPLRHGDVIHVDGATSYRIAQEEEPVLDIALGGDAARAAFIAWSLGNLHQPVEIRGAHLRVADDPASRAALDHLRVPFAPCRAVFQPVRAAAHHHHERHP